MTGEKVRRQLAAILALDVVGFSRLMHADDVAAFELVQQLGREVFEPATTQFGGTIFKHTGDGVLARFGSVHDAFEAAEAIIAQVVERGTAAVRIGIHLGDVIDSGGDVFGDSVNIACRLESIALQNGICVSERAWSDLRQRKIAFRDLGVQQLKNIETPIRVYMYGSDGEASGPLRQKGAAARRRYLVPAAVLAVAAAIGAGAWFLWERGEDGTGGEDAVLAQALDSVPCSWLDLGAVDRSSTRSSVQVEGYSSLPAARVQQLLMQQLAGKVDAGLTLDTGRVAPLPELDCAFLEAASRFRYRGLSRAELVEVVASDDPVYQERYAHKVPADVTRIYDVAIYTQDFSPNAQLFAIDAADGLQHLRPVSRISTRYPEEAGVAGGVVHALTWTDQDSPGLFFIVDSQRPIDVARVQAELTSLDAMNRFRETAEAQGWQFELVLLDQPN